MSRKTKWGIGVGLALVAGVWIAVTAAKRGNQGVEVRMEEVARRDLECALRLAAEHEQPLLRSYEKLCHFTLLRSRG